MSAGDRPGRTGRAHRAALTVLAALWCSAAAATPAGAQPAAVFDHSAFDGLLAAHVSPEGHVDYDAFGQAPAFRAYLGALARADPALLEPAERLALWINAYNAYTIELIVRHDERKSIRNINRALGLFAGKGPWKERLAEVGGRSYTLDEIEHDIIRREFDEPRIHFALVCAAVGCPPLRQEAFAGPRLEEQLQDQGRRFLLDSPEKNRVDAERRVVHLSPIFDWYREDFPAGAEGLGRYLAAFFPPGAERALLESGSFRTSYTRYDWSLNGRP